MTSRPLATTTQSTRSLSSLSTNLLSARSGDYDDVASRSDQDSDSDDDALQQRARNSRELAAADRIVLLDDEETHRLVEQQRLRGDSGGVLGRARALTRRLSGGAVQAGNRQEQERQQQQRLEHQKTLQQQVLLQQQHSTEQKQKRRARRERREQRKQRLLAGAVRGEDGALMYELEEGSMRDGSDTGDSSDRDAPLRGSDWEDGDSDGSDGDQTKTRLLANGDPHSSNNTTSAKPWDRCMLGLIYSVAAVGFALAVLGVWRLSIRYRQTHGGEQNHQPLLSNGTALFAPTTILLSLDGFRADFLQRGITPRLNKLVAEGVSPQYMTPSFPSVTFPNHYTLATGLFPESHGVVGNTFWDPHLERDFYYTDPDRSLNPEWWSSEPFWVTAEEQHIRTAIHMWPGSEAHQSGMTPSFLDHFDGKEPLENKVARLLELLDLPGAEQPSSWSKSKPTRPQLIAAYVPNVDGDGHLYGPNSTEINTTINRVDSMLDSLFGGLAERNLTDIVNIIVVSDHGMATTSTTRLLQFEDLIGEEYVPHVHRIDGWPLYGLRFTSDAPPDILKSLHAVLAAKSRSLASFDVYLRDVDMPERYHFSNNPRIAPLWIVPRTGWAIVRREELDVAEALKSGEIYHPRGLHGYDHEHPLMRAIFVARGPAFPHQPNSRVENFQNINVYNIVCDSVGVSPMPNNGTLRLPLKTIGVHRPEDQQQVPADPLPDFGSTEADAETIAEPMIETKTFTPAETATYATPKATTGAGAGAGTDRGGADGEIHGFWDWLKSQADKAWNAVVGDDENDTSHESPER